ncbi:conserved exported hypothetical protein [Tenacibaculum dicentrarchi]|nr:conserved exported hypothetical protein [Tenacibaculum dicentrarchi]
MKFQYSHTKLPFYLLLLLMSATIVSCGTMQTVADNDDGIYADDKPIQKPQRTIIVAKSKEYASKENYFTKEVERLGVLNDTDIFTDIEQYASEEAPFNADQDIRNDDTQNNYTNNEPWGYNKNNNTDVVIHINTAPQWGYYNNWDGYYGVNYNRPWWRSRHYAYGNFYNYGFYNRGYYGMNYYNNPYYYPYYRRNYYSNYNRYYSRHNGSNPYRSYRAASKYRRIATTSRRNTKSYRRNTNASRNNRSYRNIRGSKNTRNTTNTRNTPNTRNTRTTRGNSTRKYTPSRNANKINRNTRSTRTTKNSRSNSTYSRRNSNNNTKSYNRPTTSRNSRSNSTYSRRNSNNNTKSYNRPTTSRNSRSNSTYSRRNSNRSSNSRSSTNNRR